MKSSIEFRLHLLLAVAVFFAVAAPGYAGMEEDLFQGKGEAQFFKTEEKVLTTSTKYAVTKAEAPSIVRVWTEKEIEQADARSVADLLNQVVGIHLPVNVEDRRLAWIRGVRGADNSRMLLLKDGVPVKEGLYNHAYIGEFIPFHQVKQVEFIKGPGSALYGANAFSGVVNIKTKDGSDVNGKEIAVSIGKSQRREVSFVGGGKETVNWGGEEAKVDVMTYGRIFRTEGLGENDPEAENAKDNRPVKNYTAGMKLKTGNFTFRGDVISHATKRIGGEGSVDALANQDLDIVSYRYYNQLFSLDYNNSWGKEGSKTDVQLRTYFNKYDNPGLYSVPWDTGIEYVEPEKVTTRSGFTSQFTQQYGDNTLVAGLDYSRNEIDDVTDYNQPGAVAAGYVIPPQNYYIGGLYTQYTHSFPSLLSSKLTLGVRYDDHEIMGSNVSPRLGWVSNPTEKDYFKLLYGEAFRAPTAREMLMEDNKNWTSGNPNLDAETIQTLEFKYNRQLSSNLETEFVVFDNTVEDIIQKGNDPQFAGGEGYLNKGEQETTGGNVAVKYDGQTWDYNLSYGYIDATAKRETGDKQEWGIPKKMAKGEVKYTPVKQMWFKLDGRWIAEQHREEWAGFDKNIPSYSVLDVTLGTRELTEGLQTRFSVNNVLNAAADWVAEEAGEDDTYSVPRRNVMLTVEYDF